MTEHRTDNSIQIHELFQSQRQQQNNRLDVYARVLKKICVKIKIHSKKNRYQMIYRIKKFDFGRPVIKDTNACAVYLINKLTKYGFDVRSLNPITIHISWQKHIETHQYDVLPSEYTNGMRPSNVIEDDYTRLNNHLINESYKSKNNGLNKASEFKYKYDFLKNMG